MLCNGVLLVVAIRQSPLANGENSGNGNGVCRSLGARSINSNKAFQRVPGNNTLAVNLMARALNSATKLQPSYDRKIQ